MTKIEIIQSRIMERMQDILSNEQLQHLENVLAIEFHGVEVREECTQLVTSEIHWQKVLRTFIASKRIENCSQGTLERYNDCVTKLVTALNKRLQDITTNDIRGQSKSLSHRLKWSICGVTQSAREILRSWHFCTVRQPESVK